MLGSTLLLTAATLAGLVLGFAREWLLVATWGAGSRTDAYLVAMFLPEALRMMLSGGLLSAAMLPLWNGRLEAERPGWLAGQLRCWLAAALLLVALLALAAPWLVRAIGPGLSAQATQDASHVLRWLAWLLPGLLAQAVLTVPLQASNRFLLAGLGSLLFNLPAVAYLVWAGRAADGVALAQSFLLGSVLMAAVLVPGNWRLGWRPWLRGQRGDARQMWQRLWPLLASSSASQALALLERLAASLVGEGLITLVNLARKLINLPLIALGSLNQVLLGKMSGALSDSRRLLELGLGLGVSTLLTLPATAGLIAAAPALVALVLPQGLADGPLPMLLALYALGIVFGSWNALLARYYYADGDTRSPLQYELTGSAVQAALLFVLPLWWGLPGLALATLGGVLLTGVLLTRKIGQGLLAQWLRQGAVAVVVGLACGTALFPFTQHGPWVQLSAAILAGGLVFLAAGWQWLRQWRAGTEPS